MFKNYITNIYNEIITKQQWKEKQVFQQSIAPTFNKQKYQEIFPKLKQLFTKLNNGKFSPIVIMDYENRLIDMDNFSVDDFELMKLLTNAGYDMSYTSYSLGIAMKNNKEIPIKQILDSLKSKKLDQLKDQYEKTKNEAIKKQIDLVEALQKGAVSEKNLSFFGEQGKYKLVFSMNFRHIASQSTNVGWTSCMNLNTGINKHYVGSGTSSGVFIVWLAKVGDEYELESPRARVLLKPYTGSSSGTVVWRADKIYGEAPEEFKKTVESIVDKHQKYATDNYAIDDDKIYVDRLNRAFTHIQKEYKQDVDELLTFHPLASKKDANNSEEYKDIFLKLPEPIRLFVINKNYQVYSILDKADKEKYLREVSKNHELYAKQYIERLIKNKQQLTAVDSFLFRMFRAREWIRFVADGLKIENDALMKLVESSPEIPRIALDEVEGDTSAVKRNAIITKTFLTKEIAMKALQNDIPLLYMLAYLLTDDDVKQLMKNNAAAVIDHLPTERINSDIVNTAISYDAKVLRRFIQSYDGSNKIKLNQDAFANGLLKSPSHFAFLYNNKDDIKARFDLEINDKIINNTISGFKQSDRTDYESSAIDAIVEYLKEEKREKEIPVILKPLAFQSKYIIAAVYANGLKFDNKTVIDIVKNLDEKNAFDLPHKFFAQFVRTQTKDDSLLMKLLKDDPRVFEILPNSSKYNAEFIHRLVENKILTPWCVRHADKKFKLFLLQHEKDFLFNEIFSKDENVLQQYIVSRLHKFSTEEYLQIINASADKAIKSEIANAAIRLRDLLRLFREKKIKFDFPKELFEKLMTEAKHTSVSYVFDVSTKETLKNNVDVIEKIVAEVNLSMDEFSRIISTLKENNIEISDKIFDSVMNRDPSIVAKAGRNISTETFIKAMKVAKERNKLMEFFETYSYFLLFGEVPIKIVDPNVKKAFLQFESEEKWNMVVKDVLKEFFVLSWRYLNNIKNKKQGLVAIKTIKKILGTKKDNRFDIMDEIETINPSYLETYLKALVKYMKENWWKEGEKNAF